MCLVLYSLASILNIEYNQVGTKFSIKILLDKLKLGFYNKI